MHKRNKERIIYIPEGLHRSIPHNVFTGKNMEEVNKVAFEFLEKQEEKVIEMQKEEKKESLEKRVGKSRKCICWGEKK